MKIAILAPSPIPFVIGGAEKLWWGLQHHLNQLTPHETELIKVPTAEAGFWELIDAYRRFSQLDLSHFDLLISTKYPAWMTPHPRHLCYLQHKLRGLYDTYPTHLERTPDYSGALAPLGRLLMQRPRRDLVAPLFAILDELRPADLPAHAFAFPGPLTRAVIHFLDACAMADAQILAFAAISHNVAQRPDYFPQGRQVTVIYHPSDLTGFEDSGQGYLFTASRIDLPKRIGLLIEAMGRARTPMELRIAGEGPEAPALRRASRDDPRIRWLGRITDRELVQQYAGALAVPFIPFDEDYGLVTVEAMASAKPVLTCTDSGGVTEWVEPGATGWIVEPRPDTLASAIDRIAGDPRQARILGYRAREKVAHIGWAATIDALLRLSHGGPSSGVGRSLARGDRGGAQGGASEGGTRVGEEAAEIDPAAPSGRASRQRPAWVVASTFAVWPPRGGGQARIYHLYRELARHADITLVCMSGSGDAGERLLAPGLREIRIPKSAALMAREGAMEGQFGHSVGDLAAMMHWREDPDYTEALAAASAGADLVIASHCYLYPALRRVYRGPLWYDAHNVEWDMKTQILGEDEGGRPYLDALRRVEGTCCQDAQRILVCSPEDAERLDELYAIPKERIRLVPNGVDTDAIAYADRDERADLARRLGLQGRFLALFMGSWHGPNIEAVDFLLQVAPGLHGIDLLILGSICQHPLCQVHPANVYPLGLLGRRQRDTLLRTAQLGLNPMRSGSGTNLKMVEYAAAGLPILTTPHGSRGLAFRPEREVLVADWEEFAERLARLPGRDLQPMARAARDRVVRDYAWPRIAERLMAEV